MPIWTCPNPKCKYDKELHPDQGCPLCGKNAKAFKFSELSFLLKEKLSSKKAIERNNKIKRISDRIKYCPTCGSTNIFWASGLPQLWSLWDCKECGYKGALVLEDGKLGAKLRKEWKKKENFNPKPKCNCRICELSEGGSNAKSLVTRSVCCVKFLGNTNSKIYGADCGCFCGVGS